MGAPHLRERWFLLGRNADGNGSDSIGPVQEGKDPESRRTREEVADPGCITEGGKGKSKRASGNTSGCSKEVADPIGERLGCGGGDIDTEKSGRCRGHNKRGSGKDVGGESHAETDEDVSDAGGIRCDSRGTEQSLQGTGTHGETRGSMADSEGIPSGGLPIGKETEITRPSCSGKNVADPERMRELQPERGERDQWGRSSNGSSEGRKEEVPDASSERLPAETEVGKLGRERSGIDDNRVGRKEGEQTTEVGGNVGSEFRGLAHGLSEGLDEARFIRTGMVHVGQESWAEEWEGVPRLVEKQEYRAQQIHAYGNSVVPMQVRQAFMYLAGIEDPYVETFR